MIQLPHLSQKLWFFLCVGFAILLEVAADILLKKWSIDGRWWLFAIGLSVYLLGTISWAYSLRYEQLSKAIVLFTLMNLVAVTLIGMVFFKEQVSIANKVGIIFGLLSVLLIEL